MKKTSDPTIEELIKDSYAALKAGNKTIAREYALLAAEKDPASEQAWLILASMSKPDQALRYLENALRANPDSQAARKGIRLTFSQISSEGKEEEEAKQTLKEPARRLEDTTPIRVKHVQQAPKKGHEIQAVKKAKEVEPEPAAPQKEEASGKAITEAAIKATTSKKELLRKKLASKATAAPKKSTVVKKKIKPALKAKKKTVIPEAAEQIPAKEEHEPQRKSPGSQKIQEPVQVIKKAQKKIDTKKRIKKKAERGKAKAASTPIPPPAEAAEESALSSIFSSPSPEKQKEIKNQDSVWNLFSTRKSQQPPAAASNTLGNEFLKRKRLEISPEIKQEEKPKPKARPETKQKTKAKAKPKAGKVKVRRIKAQKLKKAKESRNVDVDIIEMILVSVAAILLPLLAFLYFYLTK